MITIGGTSASYIVLHYMASYAATVLGGRCRSAWAPARSRRAGAVGAVRLCRPPVGRPRSAQARHPVAEHSSKPRQLGIIGAAARCAARPCSASWIACWQ
ncbi:hypothetical protein ACU4GD_31370 [Cupriavidus basilensis]